MADLKNPVDLLVGAVLDGGWRVTEKRKRSDGGTGGHASVSYVAELDGRKAFVKAIDIQKALEAGSVESLQEQTQLFVYEQELLTECKDLSRIVTAIGSGTIPIGRFPEAGPYPVFYLLFEMADTDARQQGNLKGRVTLAQALRSLHHVFTGMQQLHNVLIAHQDLKPSNVLHFSQEQGRQSSKIGDVGRSAKFGAQLPKASAAKKQLGDWNYAAPELMYGHMLPDWKQCRLGSDLRKALQSWHQTNSLSGSRNSTDAFRMSEN